VFLGDGDELIPKTTAIGVSAAVLKALKTRGESDLRFPPFIRAPA